VAKRKKGPNRGGRQRRKLVIKRRGRGKPDASEDTPQAVTAVKKVLRRDRPPRKDRGRLKKHQAQISQR